MGRLLLFVFIAFLVWLAVRIVGSRRSPARVDPPTDAEPVRQCAWCGVHVPVAAALALPDGRVYCGPEHRDAALVAADEAKRR